MKVHDSRKKTSNEVSFLNTLTLITLFFNLRDFNKIKYHPNLA